VRACVIFNPVAKGGKARRFRKSLDEIARQASLSLTTGSGDARRLALAAVEQGFDTIVAAGGDGTLNEVLNGIGDATEGFERARLGVLPLGTINVFARELGIPSHLKAAWRIITEGLTREIDLPMAEHTRNGQPMRRYFGQLAGAGFDARAIELTDWSLKKRIGPLAYVAAGLKGMSEKQSFLRAETESGAVFEGELLLLGNGRLYGGNHPVFADAEMTDGLLDAVIFPKVRWSTLVRCGPNLLLGRRLPEGIAKAFKARQLRVSSANRALFQLDGELAGEIPALFSISTRKLRVIAPK
jgi:YegS/Rv2252/BmrU family lipid kinase